LPHYFIALTTPAQRDLREIFRWTDAEFGSTAADRYEVLLAQALSDLENNPYRAGAKPRDEVLPGVYTYHLALSRDHVKGDRVKSPRHFLVYRVTADRIDILRILHDSRDLNLHLPEEK
jgi:toxin ParE1/3/4